MMSEKLLNLKNLKREVDATKGLLVVSLAVAVVVLIIMGVNVSRLSERLDERTIVSRSSVWKNESRETKEIYADQVVRRLLREHKLDLQYTPSREGAWEFVRDNKQWQAEVYDWNGWTCSGDGVCKGP